MTELHEDDNLAVRLVRQPELAARAANAIDLVSESYALADAALFARRFLEAELGVAPGDLGEWVLREAAGILFACDYDNEADALRAIADTSADLDQASTEWHARFLARPATAAGRAARVLFDTGQIQLLDGPGGTQGMIGADGARYTPAVLNGPGGESQRAVVVTSHAGTAEVVTGFGTGLDHAAWLNDRMPGPDDPADGSLTPERLRAALPLASCADGPDCRTAREERVLAGLLQGQPGTDGLTARSFTTCTRAEIYLAWRDAVAVVEAIPNPPPLGDAVRDELARRLLRAPGWAVPFTGGPFGDRALDYYDRLCVTDVSTARIREACTVIVAEDAEALAFARAPGPRHAAHYRPCPLYPPLPDAGQLNRHRPGGPSPDGPAPLL